MNRRFLFIAISFCAVLLIFSLGLGIVERALDLLDRTADQPVLKLLAIAVVTVLAGLSLVVLWWLLKPVKRHKGPPPLTENELQERLQTASQQGVNTSTAEKELNELQRRRAAGELYIAVFGEISAGKSSLINAIVPNAEAETDVRGGTTRRVKSYAWQAATGDILRLVDVPGMNDADPNLPQIARNEALRAHLVVYLCNADLTRSQWQELEFLAGFNKPLIVALNKIDRYQPNELEQISARIEAHLLNLLANSNSTPKVQLVQISTATQRRQLVIDNNGQQQERMVTTTPQLQPLLAAMDAQLQTEPTVINQLRDQAMLAQVAAQLEAAEQSFNQERANALVRKYTGAAVIGALAAISPGSDLVIQGVLATKLVKELSLLYGVPVRDVEVEKLLNLANRRLAKSTGLALAVAGNAFKAFPGIGTVTGGLMHAVAYGLLFDSFGRALAGTLAERGEIVVADTVDKMEDLLGDNVLPRAKQLLQLAVASRKEKA